MVGQSDRLLQKRRDQGFHNLLGKAADAVYEEPEAEPQTGKEYLTEAEFYEEPEPYEESQAEPEAEPVGFTVFLMGTTGAGSMYGCSSS